MKNKHLVLLFLITVIVGLALRNAPWRDKEYFQKNLLKADSTQIVRIEFASITVVRTDMGWVAEQNNRSATVPTTEMTPILAALSSLNAIRIIQTQKPDTCGLNNRDGIPVVVYYDGHRTEYLLIGKETQDQGRAATYLSIGNSKGVYLVENALRGTFSKTLDDFRKAAVVSFHTTDVHAFLIETRLADTLDAYYEKGADRWQLTQSSRSISNDSVLIWLSSMEKLPKLPFADLFDETHEGKQLYARIRLSLNCSPDPLWVNIYRLNTLSLPEELPDLKPNDPRLAPYALYFSPFPTNYYALSDTSFLRQICQPF
jgi:hypothetical protein